MTGDKNSGNLIPANMDAMEHEHKKSTLARRTPVEWMAWMSLAAPLLAILSPMLLYQSTADRPMLLLIAIIPLIVAGIILGSVSWTGRKQHPWRGTVYVAGLGIILSLVIGLGSLLLCYLNFFNTR